MAERQMSAAYPEVETRAAVSPDDTRQALQRILVSAPFVNARRPAQFLRFIVESTLAGEEGRIKEYLIGVEVFARPSSYDPKDDPIVRIEAGRLRKKLAEYYGGPGLNDPLIIDLPKGGYVPAFQPRPLPKEPQPAAPGIEAVRAVRARSAAFRLLRVAGALVLTAALVLAAIYFVLHRAQPSATPASIAVLPFLNLSDATAGEYLSEGVAEDLTTGLAELKGLRVVAATSAFQFRGKSEDVRKIGQALNVEALLEGSISQSGDGLRINTQLINTRNGYHLWAKAYDVPAAGLFAFEENVVQETARVLRVPASGAAPAMKRDTENAEAHNLYLQGRYHWSTRQLADMLESVQLFERAIKDDPNYALAYAGLADTYTVMAINAQMRPAEALPKAREALQRALALDPNLAQAHATLGLLESQCEWNWHGAEQEFRTAIALQPNYAPAHHWAALNYMQMGQFAIADAEFRQAQVLDPLSPMISEGLAENFYDSRQYDETIKTVLNMPDPKVGWVILGDAYILKAMYTEALKLPQVAHPTDMNGSLVRAEALIHSGDRAGGMKILENLVNQQNNPGTDHVYIPPEYLAWAFAVAGDKEQAFAWLEKAWQQHDPALANLKVDPGFDSLRSDSRYLDLLKRVGLQD